MEILAKLFGNSTKVRLMRLFLFNQDNAYAISDLIQKTKSNKREVKRELAELMQIGLVKKRPIIREIHSKTQKKRKIRVHKINDTGYFIDQKFPYLLALQNLLIIVSLHADESLLKKFVGVGKIKLFIASGIFIQEWDTRVDLLIVGDNINFTKLDHVVKSIEAEVGREIAYSAFEASDFEYRYSIHDRLIRDIFDFPHTTLLNKLEIDEK